ncbi:AraC family transcriptional regulator [Lachnospiraceae bacterium 62-35]
MQVYDILIDKRRKEIPPHGSFDFPLAVYTTQINRNVLGFIHWHWHDELQFCIVTSGTVQFHINNHVLVLPEGDGLFINAEQLHKAENFQGIDSSYICFDLHPRLISSFEGSLINKKYIFPYTQNRQFQYSVLSQSVSWQKEILDILCDIYEKHEFSLEQEFSIFVNFLQIWGILQAHFSDIIKNFSPKIQSQNIKPIIEYIDNHYSEHLELEDLARNVGLAKSTCCREFKKNMNCTIFEYVTNYRLSRSAMLLLSSDYTITEIAGLCGFDSSSYFIKKFKAKTGVSPSSYRKSRMNL